MVLVLKYSLVKVGYMFKYIVNKVERGSKYL